MKLAEAIDEVKKIATRSNYDGKLTESALKECAEVYLESCDSEGTPKPRVYMRSGEGHKVTHLSEMQWLIVRTHSFRSWFGKSVVVDENGDPKVMYHGSWKSFSEFKTSSIKLSKVAMTLWSGPGFYFTDKEKVAKIYAGGEDDTVYDVFLRLENPLVVDETGNSEDGTGISKTDAEKIFLDGDNTQWLDSGIANELVRMDIAEGVKGRGKQFYKAMTRQQRVHQYVARLKTDVVKLKTAALAYGAKNQKNLLESICRHTGHDGVIHTISPDVKEWVVYDPKAIKSANDNNGDFSTAKAKVEDSVDTFGSNSRHNLQEKGSSDMVFKSLVDSLSKLVSTPAEDHAVAMDIVDRHGRHHQPKAIPEGGQYEEEGQYLHGQAKIDAAIRRAGSGKHASLLREHVAPLYAKLGHDSATRAKLQAMHEDIRGLSKGALLKGMAKHLKDMKRHAEAHNEIKDMGKEEFKAWLDAHPEYKTELTDRLLGKNMYNRHYDVKGGFHDDGTGKQKHEAWEEAKWSVGAKAMASMILFQEHADALHNAPDAIMANMIERATREEPQVENRTEQTPTEQVTAGGNSIPDNQRHMLNSLSEWDVMWDYGRTPGQQKLSAEELLNSIRNDNAIQTIREGDETFGVRGNPALADKLSQIMTLPREQQISQINSLLSSARQVGPSQEFVSQFEGRDDQYVNHPRVRESIRRYMDENHIPNTSAENHVDSQAGAGAPQAFNEHGTNLFLRDMPSDVQEWAQSQGTGSFVSSDGNQYRRDSVGGVITQHEPISSASTTQNNTNVGSNAPTYTDRDSSSNEPVYAYTDSNGQAHWIQHNEGGLKAPIHQSEVGAVQAEMRQAIADAAEGVEGAEEYFHALSHFLGRGQDARSPHPGMRQEGLLKHQLADKMQTRLDDKANAVTAAQNEHGANSEEARNALSDYLATQRAVKTIADRCGITPDMLPEGTNFNRVRNALGAPIRAANPDHQEAVNALHALANPEPAHEEQAESHTDATSPSSTASQTATVGEPTSSMTRTFGQYLHNVEENSGEHDTPETIVDMLNGGAADDEISAIREGYDNPAGELDANPALADHLEAIRRLPREQQLAHVQRLMGVEPTEGNASTNTAEVRSDGRSDTDEPMPRETDEPTTAPMQNIGEHAHSLAERIHGELDRVQRSITGAGTSATVEAIESAITRALSNPDNEYAKALMGETTDIGYRGIADAVNAIGDTPAMQAIRAEIQRRREAGNGQQNIAGVQENAQQTSNAPAQNAENASRRPFSHAGTLPQNHPLRQFTFSAENMNRSNRDVGGMPYNFTRASQVTPQRLAKLTSDLPIRGIFDHRDGTVDVPGHGRVQGGEAIRMMLTDPSSAVGSMMRQRLATWQERNGNSNSVAARAVRRMNQAMDLLHPSSSESSQSATSTSGNGSASHGSSTEGVNYHPSVTHTLSNGDKRYSQPDDVIAADTKTAQDKGFTRSGSPVDYRGRSDGCNCYRNDAALLLQDRGFSVVPQGAPSNNQKAFAELKLAMSNAYERANKGSRQDTIANLERMRQSYPNGTWISAWSGGHNVSFRLKDGQWYRYSGWDGNTRGVPVSTQLVADRIYEPPKRTADDDTTILYMAGFTGGGYARNIDSMQSAKRLLMSQGVSEADFERYKSGHATPDDINAARRSNPILSEFMQGAKNFRAYKVMTKRSLMAKGIHHPTDEQIRDEMNREPLYWKANSSYVIKPTDKLIPELFDQVRRA